MQEQKITGISINFGQAKQHALTAALDYLRGASIAGDLDGRYHGEKGQKRATKLKAYLQKVTDKDYPSLLALFIAVLGKPNAGFLGWAPGRSNRLGRLIANGWIQGEYFTSSIVNIFTLSSEVFSQAALERMVNDDENYKYGPMLAEVFDVAGWTQFDKLKASRVLLQLALQAPALQADKAEIQHCAQRLQQLLDNDKITTIRLDFLPSSPRAKLFTEGALIGAFSQQRREIKEGKPDDKKLSGLPLSGLPPEVLAYASLFLTKQEAAQSLLVNHAAARNAKQYENERRSEDAKAATDAAASTELPAAAPRR